jgi:hypothetical protein
VQKLDQQFLEYLENLNHPVFPEFLENLVQKLDQQFLEYLVIQ